MNDAVRQGFQVREGVTNQQLVVILLHLDGYTDGLRSRGLDRADNAVHGTRLMSAEEPTELAAILEGAYWTFLHLRLARRSAERGKVHGRSFRGFLEMAHELADADAGALLSALEYVHRVRGPVEDEVLAGTGLLDVGHEWSNFVTHVTEFKAAC